MTNVPEAPLALESRSPRGSRRRPTDCWLEDPAQHVSAHEVLAAFRANLERVQRLLAHSIAQYEEDETRASRQGLRGALVTPRASMTDAQRELVDLLLS
jgi:hypothetical protein